VTDAQISKLLGTTKATIDQVRSRSHWNSSNIKPVDPVSLGLVMQLELDAVVRKAAEKKAKDDAKKGIVSDGPSLRPAAETGVVYEEPVRVKHLDQASVFSNLQAAPEEDED
jgi:hypothetical protein